MSDEVCGFPVWANGRLLGRCVQPPDHPGPCTAGHLMAAVLAHDVAMVDVIGQFVDASCLGAVPTEVIVGPES